MEELKHRRDEEKNDKTSLNEVEIAFRKYEYSVLRFVFVRTSEKYDKNLYTSRRRYLSLFKKSILKAFVLKFKRNQIEMETGDLLVLLRH